MEVLRVPLHEDYPLIKPLVGFRADIEGKLAKFPFERNVFLMMKYRPHNAQLSDFITETLATHHLNGVRADVPQWNITNNVYNPIAVLYCCKFGLALFDEPEEGQAYSANVAYELGILHLQGKECLILAHSSLPETPFDLIKDLHQSYTRELDVRPIITKWAAALTPSTPPPPATQAPTATPPVTSAPSLPGVAFETPGSNERLQIADAAIQVIGQNAAYWRLSWRLTIQSRMRGDSRVRLHLRYLDGNHFLLDEQLEEPPDPILSVSARQFSDKFLLEAPLAKRLAFVEVRAEPIAVG